MKDIPGYEGLYAITEDGQIWHMKHERFLKPQLTNKGYLQIGLSKNDVRKYYKVHRLVGFTYLPADPSRPEINHIDRNRTNNRSDNLEWATRKENVRHAMKYRVYTKRKRLCSKCRGDL